MAQRRQTSVRISQRALQYLSRVAAAWQVSREQAARDLLQDHLAAQEACDPEERLTHISTVLRFPPPPPGRGRSDGRVRLAVRLDDGVVARAAAVSLRLPGQAVHRAHRDYGSRPLTDALVTAVAGVASFVDEGLEGLPALLTHREALGLWRLTVAATLTHAEQRALFGPPSEGAGPAGVARREALRGVLREEDVAWHSPWRFEVARHLAQRLLVGPQAAANLRMLREQSGRFEQHRSDLELTDDLDHDWVAGLRLGAGDSPGRLRAGNPQGRGGAAVWRAERSLALDDLARWLTGSTPGTGTGAGDGTGDEEGSTQVDEEGSTQVRVDPPGWTLAAPQGWRGHRFRWDGHLGSQQQADLAAGRVLRLDAGSRSVLWPYDTSGRPVDGFDAVLAGAGIGASAVAPVELVELVLVTAEDLEAYPRVPAPIACELGFIAPAERDALVADAAERNQREVAAVLRRAARLLRAQQEALHAASGDLQRFAALARASHLQCRLTHPAWTWSVESVAEALATGATPAQLRWLAGAVRHMHRYVLERSMERASHRGFWLGGTVVDDDGVVGGV